MVWALALVTVGQYQNDRRALAPLLLRGADELVDDGLGAAGEVAELCLPQHQSVGTLDGVAVLEAHRCELGQQRVIDPETALVLVKVLQRGPLLGVHLVDQHRVTLHEGAST